MTMPASRCAQLQALIHSDTCEFLMEAHSGLSARIAQDAGFKGIWASGLSISAVLGVRDNNEVSWTQMLEIYEYMSDATHIPILVDGDTGYGNYNNVRRLVRKLESRQIAGVCIEDKLFPKSNSLRVTCASQLITANEMVGKIKAGKDTQRSDDFVIVARTEALIAGCTLTEAINRAEAYRQAGADAIVVHSKQETSTEIDNFMSEWGGRHPVIAIPTTYSQTPTEHFKKLGISLLIWANHNVRASILAMQKVCRLIHEQEAIANIGEHICELQTVFQLQNCEELETANKRYLPGSDKTL